MKVLFFCVLAIYGAIAQEDSNVGIDADAGVDASAGVDVNAGVNVSSTLDKWASVAGKITPGNLLGAMVDGVNTTMSIKGNIVGESLSIGSDAVNMGTQAAQQGLTGAQSILNEGLSTGKNVKDTIISGSGSIVDKSMNIVNSATGNKLTGITSAVNATIHAGLDIGDKAANFGMDAANSIGSKGMELAKNVIEKAGSSVSSGLGFIGKIDQAINKAVVNKTASFANAASNAGQNVGSWIANSWKLRA